MYLTHNHAVFYPVIGTRFTFSQAFPNADMSNVGSFASVLVNPGDGQPGYWYTLDINAEYMFDGVTLRDMPPQYYITAGSGGTYSPSMSISDNLYYSSHAFAPVQVTPPGPDPEIITLRNEIELLKNELEVIKDLLLEKGVV